MQPKTETLPPIKVLPEKAPKKTEKVILTRLPEDPEKPENPLIQTTIKMK